MNEIAEEITDYLIHHGVKFRSGRYPYGSGENPYQHCDDFLSRVDSLKSEGLKETEIAKALGLSTTELRVQLSLAKNERRALRVATAKSLREDGYSLNEIAEKMGFANDSSVRSLLNENSAARMNRAQNTADKIRQAIDEKGLVDVGKGVELQLGVSRETLNEALYLLYREGYEVYGGGIPQVTNKGKQSNTTIIGPPGTAHKDIYDFGNVNSLDDYISYDNGDSFRKAFEYPSSMDSSRMKIRYNEEGGLEKDGLIEIRPGVADLSLGDSTYAQVRIMVDGTHYMKGMAVYSDDLPDGVDVIFNTNKHVGTATTDVLKPIKSDPANPFGSLIKEHGGQSYYDDPNGKYTDPVTGKKQSLSLINKRAEEGDWDDWADTLPSQFLSKQSLSLARKQIGISVNDKQAEFDDICALTNPTVKKVLLESFANDCDSAAVHLKAAALPRQKYKVIVPITDIKDTEVYAPGYNDGETVALIRYPHAGTFEIPILTVNNGSKQGKQYLGNTPADAIGITKKNADRMSGADFDGDTVMVIPCNSSTSNVKITSTKPLKELEGFDTKEAYGTTLKVAEDGSEHYYRNGKEVKTMSKGATQKQMGVISNLITDMTIKGAPTTDLAKAVKHSMVVIDAEKHKLDYKQSEIDNDIATLKSTYQGHYDENGDWRNGASTLLSSAKSKVVLPYKRKGSPIINDDGSLSYKEVVETYVDKKGKTQIRTTNSTKMAEAKDARTLISDYDTPMENLYADYANTMKSMANKARVEKVNTGKIAYSSTAKKTYSEEVNSLDKKLTIALMNAPRERQAQVIANATVAAKKKEYPELAENKKELKKEEQRALAAARAKVGAKRTPVEITDREWEAIQSGAVSENKLRSILNNTDLDKVRERATPRERTTVSAATLTRMRNLKNSGYTTAEIAENLGIAASTVSKYLSGKR